jgi:hypothetical protein
LSARRGRRGDGGARPKPSCNGSEAGMRPGENWRSRCSQSHEIRFPSASPGKPAKPPHDFGGWSRRQLKDARSGEPCQEAGSKVRRDGVAGRGTRREAPSPANLSPSARLPPLASRGKSDKADARAIGPHDGGKSLMKGVGAPDRAWHGAWRSVERGCVCVAGSRPSAWRQILRQRSAADGDQQRSAWRSASPDRLPGGEPG